MKSQISTKSAAAGPKVLLYTEFEHLLANSGLGKAIRHQIQALEENNLPYTLDPKDDWDIAHLNYYGPNSRRIARLAHKRGKLVIYHAHSTQEDFRNSFIFSNQLAPMFKKWLISCYQLGDWIVTPTPYAKSLLEGYGLAHITVISNGVDTKFFCRDESLGQAWRRTYGYRVDDKIVLGIGLYLERKGIIDFVELARRLPAYQFIWFGATDLSLVPDKVRQAVRTQLPNLRFGGQVPATAIKAALNGADLFVFPTFEETEGIPALEAAACRCPLLVRDIPVFHPWLTGGQNAYVAADIDGFDRQIRAFFAGNLPDWRDNAWRVAAQHDLQVVGGQLIELYRELYSRIILSDALRIPGAGDSFFDGWRQEAAGAAKTIKGWSKKLTAYVTEDERF